MKEKLKQLKPILNMMVLVFFVLFSIVTTQTSAIAVPLVPSAAALTTIMPLGNSITQGSASGEIAEARQVSYRIALWEMLTNAGYDIDFVGSLNSGSKFLTIDAADHEGHPGWTDVQIADSIYAFLETNPAEIVLLHIGTNGLDSSPDDVKKILDEIDRYEVDYSTEVTVILARIINRATHSATTALFNDNVENMAYLRVNDPDNIAYPDKIIFGSKADMEDGAGIDYGLYPTGDMNDNLHPYQYGEGYAKMADVWFFALVDILPVPDGCYLYPRFEETTLTEGVEYYTDRTYTLTSVPICSFLN